MVSQRMMDLIKKFTKLIIYHGFALAHSASLKYNISRVLLYSSESEYLEREVDNLAGIVM